MQKFLIFAAVIAGGYYVLAELGPGTTEFRPASKGSIITGGPARSVSNSSVNAAGSIVK